jgi:hypothetical protein
MDTLSISSGCSSGCSSGSSISSFDIEIEKENGNGNGTVCAFDYYKSSLNSSARKKRRQKLGQLNEDSDADANASSYINLSSVASRHHLFIKTAMEEARKSDILHKHGCVIGCHGRIYARGFNSNRTSSKDGLIKDSCSCHAEISALRSLATNMGYRRGLVRGHYSHWVQPRGYKEIYEKTNHLYCPSIK